MHQTEKEKYLRWLETQTFLISASAFSVFSTRHHAAKVWIKVFLRGVERLRASQKQFCGFSVSCPTLMAVSRLWMAPPLAAPWRVFLRENTTDGTTHAGAVPLPREPYDKQPHTNVRAHRHTRAHTICRSDSKHTLFIIEKKTKKQMKVIWVQMRSQTWNWTAHKKAILPHFCAISWETISFTSSAWKHLVVIQHILVTAR